jgi:hypothetical protein
VADREGRRLSHTRCDVVAVEPVRFKLVLDNGVLPVRLRLKLEAERGWPRMHRVHGQVRITGPSGFELSEELEVPLFARAFQGCDPPADDPDACRNHVDPVVPINEPAFEPRTGGWPFFREAGEYVVELRDLKAMCDPSFEMHACRDDQPIEIEPLRFQIEPSQLRR